MKRNRISICTALLSMVMLMVTGCDDNMPQYRQIPLLDVALGEELRGGLTMEEGTTADISLKVVLTPEDASDRAENYSSSNTSVATVSQYGIISALVPGTCEITITVGGKSVGFTLTVIETIKRPFESIEFAIAEASLKVGQPYDVSAMVVVTPMTGHNDALRFSSSDPGVFTVTEDGILTGSILGDATLTVSSTLDPSVKATLPVKVDLIDYDRSGWEVSDHNPALFVATGSEVNSKECLFSGDPQNNVFMALVRPSKTFNGVSNPTKEAGGYTQFTVDMKVAQKVNYFRIGHRNGNVQLRYYKIERIYGSNDGVNFTDVTTDFVDIPSVTSETVIESPDVRIPTTAYRYYRFWCQDDSCWKSMSEGASVQMTQFWMGYNRQWE